MVTLLETNFSYRRCFIIWMVVFLVTGGNAWSDDPYQCPPYPLTNKFKAYFSNSQPYLKQKVIFEKDVIARSIALSPDGTKIAIGDYKANKKEVWDIDANKKILERGPGTGGKMVFNKTGDKLYYISYHKRNIKAPSDLISELREDPPYSQSTINEIISEVKGYPHIVELDLTTNTITRKFTFPDIFNGQTTFISPVQDNLVTNKFAITSGWGDAELSFNADYSRLIITNTAGHIELDVKSGEIVNQLSSTKGGGRKLMIDKVQYPENGNIPLILGLDRVVTPGTPKNSYKHYAFIAPWQGDPIKLHHIMEYGGRPLKSWQRDNGDLIVTYSHRWPREKTNCVQFLLVLRDGKPVFGEAQHRKMLGNNVGVGFMDGNKYFVFKAGRANFHILDLDSRKIIYSFKPFERAYKATIRNNRLAITHLNKISVLSLELDP